MGTPSAKMLPFLGAELTQEGVCFRLWSTRARQAAVALFSATGRLNEERPLAPEAGQCFAATYADLGSGTRYLFELDGELVPDPYARYLPEGVHAPAMVWPADYAWRHPRSCAQLDSGLVIYELHIGTFTPEGTFAAARDRLAYLRDLGATALELLPLSAFPGRRGWGYDGVAHFAPYAGYGTPDDLRALVDVAHGLGLAVILDVVYNHFGPDGNYLARYSPEYFTARHKTPWGDAPDFSSPWMRRLVLENTRYWLERFRCDGLRLDATHAIFDDEPESVLTALAAVAHAVPSRPLVIAEDEHSSTELVTVHGLDGVWADRFHHEVHILLTGERDGYYARYDGTVAALAGVINDDAHGRRAGDTATSGVNATGRARTSALATARLIYCIQNHDQVGNRALGERLSALTSAEGFAAACALLLFLPTTPLIWMGQEWAASSPFLYFTDHEPELGLRVSKGRREEFRHFRPFADREQRSRIPDPQSESTFAASRLCWEERAEAGHREVLSLHRRMLELRRTDPVLRDLSAELVAQAVGDLLIVRRANAAGERVLFCNFGPRALGLTLARERNLAPRDLITGTGLSKVAARTAVIMTPSAQEWP